MQLDATNAVVELCIQGLEYEGLGERDRAIGIYQLAWQKAATDFEKFTAAHYLARHQTDPANELEWNQVALKHAILVDRERIKQYLPSLYLNVAKSFEKLGDWHSAFTACEMASSYSNHLSDNGYGKMVLAGVKDALARLSTRL